MKIWVSSQSLGWGRPCGRSLTVQPQSGGGEVSQLRVRNASRDVLQVAGRCECYPSEPVAEPTQSLCELPWTLDVAAPRVGYPCYQTLSRSPQRCGVCLGEVESKVVGGDEVEECRQVWRCIAEACVVSRPDPYPLQDRSEALPGLFEFRPR